MTGGANWDALPEEMRWNEQWLLAGPNEKGELKVPYTIRHGKPAPGSNKDPSQWMDFETCCEYAASLGWGIGFVLSADDPYTCIDLDVKNNTNEPDPAKWTTQEQLDRFWRIVQAFDSYTERSRSGLGLHVWVRGSIGLGCKRDGVEVYSQERFMACTGNAIFDKPIAHRQEMLDILVGEIRRAGTGAAFQLEELDEEFTDEEIFDRAINAGNADKFNALCACTGNDESTGELGSYHALGYPSQSEADLALMSIFTFYSKSNAQCKRLFRMTGLGKRSKATKDDRYLNSTLRLIRARQNKEAVIDEHGKAMAMSLVQELQMSAPVLDVPPVTTTSPSVSAAPEQAVTETGLPWPPGCAGALAYYIYNSSPRPVKEVAIVSALGFLAGVCGKAYLIPQSGINLYIILVARSAVGKEAMHSGIGNILAHLRERVPTVHRFVDFADFASGPALQKACANNPSFVNVAGEWGRKLKRLAHEDGRDAAMQSLRTVMTNLYQKSGPTSVVGGLSYSNKEQNVASVNGVAYSMIGETTPRTFYDSLTEAMMEDGFMSRFTVVEYNGERPAANPNPQYVMDHNLFQAMEQLVAQAGNLIDRFGNCMVQFEPSAKQILDDFNYECDNEINATDDEGWRQMWNRAHLKVLRVAALLAVADNHAVPVVYPHHAQWALGLIRRDIALFMRRINAGDVGTGDGVRERKLLAIMKEYLEDGVPDSYKVPDTLQKAGIIPRKVLQLRCARVTAFSEHRNGAIAAMDIALRSLVDSGYIMEVDKAKVITEYNFHGKCYRVLSLPSFTADKKKRA